MKRENRIPLLIAACVVLVSAFFVPVAAEEPVAMSQDNSDADDVASNIDRRKRLEGMFGAGGESIEWLEKWRETRDGAMKKIGLDLSASYHVVGLAAFGGGDPDTGLGGDLTVNGTWHLGGERWNLPLDLNFRVRHRHAFGDIAPAGVASQTGALWGLVDGFSDKGLEVPDFQLVQKIPKYGMELRYGQMVVESQFDRHALRSSKQAFLNRAFSSNPAVAFPRFGTGVTLHRQSPRGLDFTLGACSVQGTKTGTQVDINFGSDAFFKAGQVGWDFEIHDDPARIQAMAWHSDAVADAGLPDGAGLSLVFERAFPARGARVFARAAWADGAAADLNLLLAAGAAVDRRDNDLLGLALGVGRDSSGTDDVQGVIECFYRWQIGATIHITPSVQVLFGESLPGRDLRLVAGLRGEVAF